jgi:hypothetical protein
LKESLICSGVLPSRAMILSFIFVFICL